MANTTQSQIRQAALSVLREYLCTTLAARAADEISQQYAAQYAVRDTQCRNTAPETAPAKPADSADADTGYYPDDDPGDGTGYYPDDDPGDLTLDEVWEALRGAQRGYIKAKPGCEGRLYDGTGTYMGDVGPDMIVRLVGRGAAYGIKDGNAITYYGQ